MMKTVNETMAIISDEKGNTRSVPMTEFVNQQYSGVVLAYYTRKKQIQDEEQLELDFIEEPKQRCLPLRM